MPVDELIFGTEVVDLSYTLLYGNVLPTSKGSKGTSL